MRLNSTLNFNVTGSEGQYGSETYHSGCQGPGGGGQQDGGQTGNSPAQGQGGDAVAGVGMVGSNGQDVKDEYRGYG